MPFFNRSFTKNVPTHLQHKPIIACDYKELIPDEDISDDTEYVSIGRAQYDQTGDVSIKIMRRTEGGKWARGAEEVPYWRLPGMMQLLLLAILHIQRQGDWQSDAQEEAVAPNELPFLEDMLSNPKKKILLQTGLNNILALLKEVDFSRL